MRAILLLIGGIVLANIVAATFFWRTPAQGKQEPIVNSATLKGQEPWMANEHYIDSSRQSSRKSLLETLGKPWSSFCEPQGGMTTFRKFMQSNPQRLNLYTLISRIKCSVNGQLRLNPICP